MTPDKKVTEVVFYTRLSKDDEKRNGVSIEVQLERLNAYAKSQGWMVVGEPYVDKGVSGKTLDRPAMKRLRSDVAAGKVQCVAFMKLDRLSRSRRDVEDLLAEWESKGVAVVSLQEHLDTSTAMGRFVLGLIASLAQLERETISERTHAALRHLRQQGKHIGAVPFGMMIDASGILVRDPKRWKWLLQMRKWRKAGWTLRRIAAALQDASVMTRSGKPWSAMSVKHVLNHSRKVKGLRGR